MATLKFQIKQINKYQNKEFEFMYQQYKNYRRLKQQIIDRTLRLKDLDNIPSSEIDLLKIEIYNMIDIFYEQMKKDLDIFTEESYFLGFNDITRLSMNDIDGEVDNKLLDNMFKDDTFNKIIIGYYKGNKNRGLVKSKTFIGTLELRKIKFKQLIAQRLELFRGDLYGTE